jgi:hypothetical protein
LGLRVREKWCELKVVGDVVDEEGYSRQVGDAVAGFIDVYGFLPEIKGK